MATKLNQIIAIESGVKSSTEKLFTELHQKLQKPALLAGHVRRYTPRDAEGEQLPNDEVRIQLRANDAIREATDKLTRLFDITATKEFANCDARADITLPDGTVLLTSVPVTYLLFLEKQLVNIRTFVAKLPILDSAEDWTFDASLNAFKTNPVPTIKTKKVLKVIVKYEATDKHPAQTETYNDDVTVGTWETRKFSGALQQVRVNSILERVEALQQAVKKAREQANELVITDQKIGKTVFDYLFQ